MELPPKVWAMVMKKEDNTLRIIGGKWRSRKVTFADNPALRPTADRIRETLFNWLQPYLAGARVLELYAGSGALSLEALSRGAGHATLVEKDAATLRHLQGEFSRFADPGCYQLVQGDALAFAAEAGADYDLIFLDPPFGETALAQIVAEAAALLGSQGLLYVESGQPLDELLPAGMEGFRQKRAGAVHYGLFRRPAG